MVTINDISKRCEELAVKYNMGTLGFMDLIDLAILVTQHSQDRIRHPELHNTYSPYVVPGGVPK